MRPVNLDVENITESRGNVSLVFPLTNTLKVIEYSKSSIILGCLFTQLKALFADFQFTFIYSIFSQFLLEKITVKHFSGG